MTGRNHCKPEVGVPLVGNSDFFRERGVLQLQPPVKFITLNARAVELIAKPGKSRELRACIRRELVSYLRTRNGFAGTFVLTSHKEPRLHMVLSFWKTEKEASDNHWEDSAPVRRLVSPLADVCRKVQTYEAVLPDTAEAPLESIRAHRG